MKYAVIDIGSNTIRLCAYTVENGVVSQYLNRPIMARLGSKTENGALTQAGMEVACEALLTLREEIASHGVEAVFVFATAAFRNISNTEAVVAEIECRTGFTIDVLSGEDEALFTASGAQLKQPIEDGLIADIGGGSTELVLIKNGKPVQATSLAIGSLTAFVRFVGKRPANRQQITALRTYIREQIATVFAAGAHGAVLYGIGGAARVAAKLEKNLYPASGGAIQTLETLLYRLLDDEELAEKSILQAGPERMDTALPGVAILCEIANYFGCKQLDVCCAGVREGYLWQQIALREKEGQ